MLFRHPWRALVLALPACPFPAAAFACACGCGVFDVGTASMFPARSGGSVFLEADFVDQDRNWSGSSRAPATDNEDREVRTWFTTVGAAWSFNADWSLNLRVPYWRRRFATTRKPCRPLRPPDNRDRIPGPGNPATGQPRRRSQT